MGLPDPTRCEVEGISVAVRQAGSGPALVLLHGFLCDSRVWRPQMLLADRFTVIAWDAPGAGASADPPEPYTITDWASGLAALLDDVGMDAAHLVGLSWGGILAQEFYRAFPTRVRSLVLADTYAGWHGSLGAEAAEQRLERCLRDATLPIDEFLARWVPEFFTDAVDRRIADEMAAIVAEHHPLGFRLMAEASAVTDTTDLLPEIAVPTLLLWGDQDRRSPIGVAEAMHAAIPTSCLELIADAGHVSNLEQPDAFNHHVATFCSAIDAHEPA